MLLLLMLLMLLLLRARRGAKSVAARRVQMHDGFASLLQLLQLVLGNLVLLLLLLLLFSFSLLLSSQATQRLQLLHALQLVFVSLVHTNKNRRSLKQLHLLVFADEQLTGHVPLGSVFPEMFCQRRNVLVALTTSFTLEFFLETSAFAFGNASGDHFSAQNRNSACRNGLCDRHTRSVAVEMEIGGMVGTLVDGKGALGGGYGRPSSGRFVGHVVASVVGELSSSV